MEVMNIPLGEIVSSPMNPRKTFDEGDLSELAENIRHQGLLQPVTVRPVTCSRVLDPKLLAEGRVKYELVCGDRRFRAYSSLLQDEGDKWESIPAMVRELDDAAALDAMITENLQRKDVDPIEEAFAFGKLAETGASVEEIAARFGKSPRFVSDRIRLNSLIPELMLRVREGKMALGAAQIIARFDEGRQREFYQCNAGCGNISRYYAVQFAERVFHMLRGAPWDKDYEGGCGRKCGECPLNTANSGCLFSDLSDGKDARCTDPDKYIAKHISNTVDFVKAMGKDMVKVGERIGKGKTVVVYDTSYKGYGNFDAINRKTRDRLIEEGFEVVTPDAFGDIVWRADEKDVAGALAEGKVYRCVTYSNGYNLPEPRISYYNVRKDADGKATAPSDTTPSEVLRLIAERKSAKSSHDAKLLDRLGAQAGLVSHKGKTGLSEQEQLLFDALIVSKLPAHVIHRLTGSTYTLVEDLLEYVRAHPEQRAEWYACHIAGSFGDPRMFLPLNETGKAVLMQWDREGYERITGDEKKKLDKKSARIADKLAALGYGPDGKRLCPKPDMCAQFTEMKAKHPDALLLFRVGDFYECYGNDAEDASEILRTTITSRKRADGTTWRVSAFPHKALEDYLPKLVRAGRRCAVCEQLDDRK